MEWRKHDNSSFARNVWLWDVTANRHTRLTDFGADDRQPVWGPDDDTLYYLSERGGTFNVWRARPRGPDDADAGDDATARTRCASSRPRGTGDLCYALDGELWVRPAAPGRAAGSRW